MAERALKQRGDQIAANDAVAARAKVEGGRGMSALPSPPDTERSFQSLRWQRSALTVIAASRRNDPMKQRMTFLAAAVAADFACFADKAGLLFRSARDIAEAVGASESNVREAVAQLMRAGLVEVPAGVKKQTGKKTKGRDATTYRLIAVDISHLHTGGKSDVISSCTQAENEGAISAPMQAAFSAPTGATTVGRTDKGAGARVNAPPAPPSGDTVIEEGADAHERAPASLSPAAGDPVFASEIPEPASLDSQRRPVTLSDLDRLAAEEWAAANTPQALAAAALADLQGDRLLDPSAFVDDLVVGFIDDDTEAAAHIAVLIAYDLLEARGAARELWAAQRAIASELFRAVAPDRAEEALAALHGAVREAGEAEKASRKAAVEHEEAETKSAAMKGSAHD